MLETMKTLHQSALDIKKVAVKVMFGAGNAGHHFAYHAAKNHIQDDFNNTCSATLQKLTKDVRAIALSMAAADPSHTELPRERYDEALLEIDDSLLGFTLETEFIDIVDRVCDGKITTISYSIKLYDFSLDYDRDGSWIDYEEGCLNLLIGGIATLCNVDRIELLKRAIAEIPFLSDPVIKFDDYKIKVKIIPEITDDYIKVIKKAKKDGYNIVMGLDDMSIMSGKGAMILDAIQYDVLLAFFSVEYNYGIYFPEFTCELSDLLTLNTRDDE